MKFEVKDEKNCIKIIDVIVDSERVNKSKQRIFNEIKENALIEGYRKGKAPDDLVKLRFDSKIKEEVIKDIVPSTYSEIMQELKLKIVSDPVLNEIKYNENGEIFYKIKVETNPEFEVKNYKNIKIKEKKLEEITEKDVERELNKIRQYMGKLIDAQHDKVKKDDYAIVSISAFIDNKEVPELTADNFTINVGANKILKEIEEGIIGMQKGEEKEIEFTFPDDYFNKNYAGKKALFKVKLKNIKQIELPEANDEFAKTLGDFKSIEELKNKIKEDLKKQAEADIKKDKIEQIIAQLLKDNVFEVPRVFIEQEITNLVNRYLNNLAQQGLTLEKIGETIENLRKSFEKVAEENVRLIYILDKIAEVENIKVSDEVVKEEIQKVAKEIGQDPEAITKQIREKGEWEVYRLKILEDKVIDFLLSNSVR